VSSTPFWVDSHCHLQNLAADDRESTLDQARATGVRGFLVPAIRLEEAEGLLEFAARHADVWLALGVHPHEAGTWQPAFGERLLSLSREDKVVAVGECGLDFFYDHAPRDVQAEVLREHFRVALAADLPVVVHNRESDDSMLAVIREPEFAELRADFHSFAGSPAMLDELVARGHRFGFSGMVTFAKADNIRSLLARVPDDRILIETDTPFLAPAPHRGKSNRPAWVALVGERVARERGWELDDARRRTSANFFAAFPKAVRAIGP
jgi:TatD DNase family protein